MNVGHSITAVLRTIRVKSAVNPLLWLCGLISLPLFLIQFVLGSFLFYLSSIAILPIIAVLVAYFYFMFKNPDYLRSEEFHIQKKSLELIGEKGQEFLVTSEDIAAPR